MLKKYSLMMALVLATAATASASLRTISAGDMIRVRYSGYGYRQGSGGEFQVGLEGVNPNYFHTFCAEQTEYIYDNELVKVAGTSLMTNQTGKSLSSGAAKLYSEYYAGIAANNYGFGGSLSNITVGGQTFRLGGTDAERATDGEALQQALWKLLGWTQSFSSVKAEDFYNYGAGIANDGNYYGVRILNLASVNGEARQDQFGVIPEPATLLIWGGLGLGMAAFGICHRRARADSKIHAESPR
jgi:hypothetical protein